MPSLPRDRTTLAFGALFAAVFLLFLPSIGNGFINFDDPIYLLSNPHVQHGLGWSTVRWAFTTGYAANWHPLTWLSHALDWQLFRADPWGHHLINVFLHATAAALLFLVLQKMTGAFWRSVFVAALFGMHPLRVESVVWASERKDVLAALFWMLTLLAYTEWAQKTAAGADGRRRRTSYSLALGFFTLGLLSKPMLVTLPFALLLLDYWPLGRCAGLADLKRRALEKIPFFALSLAVCVITYRVQQRGGTFGVLTLTPGERLANGCVAYIRYLGKFFAPVDLTVVYPLPLTGKWPAAAVVTSALYLLVLTAAVLAQARRRPYLFTGWFWFLGTMIPVIGLVQVGIQSMADRYTYLPMIGPALALTWGACEVAGSVRLPKSILPALAGVVLAGCALFTVRGIGWWRDSGTLFRHALDVTDENPLAEMDLGCALAQNGEVDDAILHFQQAINLADALPEARFNLGLALFTKGDYPGAAVQFKGALVGKPDDDWAHFYLGLALEKSGDWADAAGEFKETLRLDPDFDAGHFHLGLMLARMGDFKDAIAQLREVLRLNPRYSAARANLESVTQIQDNSSPPK